MAYNLDNLWARVEARPTNSYQEVRDLHWLLVALALIIELRGLRRILSPVYVIPPSPTKTPDYATGDPQ